MDSSLEEHPRGLRFCEAWAETAPARAEAGPKKFNPSTGASA
ncbi:MAG: hypothetical protein QXI02_07595 [Candidatus Caldarchaeum sp.]